MVGETRQIKKEIRRPKVKRKAMAALVIIILTIALGSRVGLGKDKEEPQLDPAQILQRLEEVLTNQQEMFKQFEEVKQELEIIRVRASR
jgi:hypothetical protein